jgi:hypothetical protein
MTDMCTRKVRIARQPMFYLGIGCVLLALVLSSCSSNLQSQRENLRVPSGSPAPPYSIIFMIHGDGDYIYHDTSGIERTADEEALAGAKRVAERNPRAEVFIFHQIPRKHFLFFFPVQDGEFYYYRNGRLIASELYWRDGGGSHLDPEATLYRSFSGGEKGTGTRFFVYCGHEIPEFPSRGYDASSPDRRFSIDDLADGLKAFTPDSARFDLLILSTCYGGTPYSIGGLGKYARLIIASPDNLHLSYFDLHPLERLDNGLHDGNVRDFADRFARQSFERLTGEMQTSVSVALYDVDRVQEFVRSVQEVYDRKLDALKTGNQDSVAMTGRCDCADIHGYALPFISQGVEVFYRPANFGRARLKKGHSGWECWSESGEQASATKKTDPSLK